MYCIYGLKQSYYIHVNIYVYTCLFIHLSDGISKSGGDGLSVDGS